MTQKLTNLIFLLFLLVVSIIYFVEAIGFVLKAEDNIQNAGFYPTILSSIIIILIIGKLIEGIRVNDNERFSVENLKYIFMTLGLTIVYVFLWSIFNAGFYVFTFIFYFILVTIFTKANGTNNKKAHIRNLLISLGFALIIYLMFGLLFEIRF